MSLTDVTKPTDVSLNTDLYELTMAQGFWENDLMDAEACFTVFFRDAPFDGGYAVACGTGQIADLVENFRYTDEDIAYLGSLSAPGGGAMFKPAFLEWLRTFAMDVDVWAVPEGQVVFPASPSSRPGPMAACQLIETALLNLVNFQTLVATKTARVVQAAEGHAVSDLACVAPRAPTVALPWRARPTWAARARPRTAWPARSTASRCLAPTPTPGSWPFPQRSTPSVPSPARCPRTACCSSTPTTCTRASPTP